MYSANLVRDVKVRQDRKSEMSKCRRLMSLLALTFYIYYDITSVTPQGKRAASPKANFHFVPEQGCQ